MSRPVWPAGPDPETYVKLASEYSELQPLVARSALPKPLSERADLKAMLTGETDREMRELAEMECRQVKERIETLEEISSSCCCPRTQPMSAAPSSKFAPAPAAGSRPVRRRPVPHV
jgi:protein subunit release factor A